MPAQGKCFLTMGLLVTAPFSLFAQTSNVPATSTVHPTYDNSAGGLKHQIEDAMKAAKNHDRSNLMSLTTNMVLPDPDLWFTRVFGAQLGAAYEKQYAPSSSRIPSSLADFLEDTANQKFTGVQVVRFTKACDSSADEMQYPVLISREIEEPLGIVLFHRDNSYTTLQFFAYIDGAFRYVGNLKPSQISRPGSTGTKQVKSDANVQAARILKQIPPVYPDEARRQHIEGEVVLHAILTREGTISELRVLKGRCALAGPAINAVRQWQYSPTLLEGNPVEVDTTITVTFALARR